MKAFKQVLMSVSVTLVIVALVGCGVSEEEHEKTLAELDKVKAELAQANAKIAEMEKSEVADTGMQDKLAAAQKAANNLRAKVKSLTGENANLQNMLKKLKAQYAEIQKKLEGLQSPIKELPAVLPKKR